MSRAMETRLRKLEAVAKEPEGDLIPIYSDPWKFEETVDALISRGDIAARGPTPLPLVAKHAAGEWVSRGKAGKALHDADVGAGLMTKAIETRLRNLERRKDVEEPVPVFCRSEADFDVAFARKVKWGLCDESDRHRALPWTHERFAELRAARDEAAKRLIAGEGRVPIPRFGTHEEWLYVSGIIP